MGLFLLFCSLILSPWRAGLGGTCPAPCGSFSDFGLVFWVILGWFWFQAEDQNLGQVRAAGAAPARRHHRRRAPAVPEGSAPQAQGQAHQDGQWGETKLIFPSFSPLSQPQNLGLIPAQNRGGERPVPFLCPQGEKIRGKVPSLGVSPWLLRPLGVSKEKLEQPGIVESVGIGMGWDLSSLQS